MSIAIISQVMYTHTITFLIDAAARYSMTRRQKDPLRPLAPEEQTALERLSRSQTEPASHVARAKALLAVAAGASYSAAAQTAGRRSGDAVAHLVTRFNQQGLAAIVPGHGGGPPPTYPVAERNRILAEVRRMPDRERDGTATWSLMTLRHALRTAPNGLPNVSTATIRAVLIEAGWSWQRSRSWCATGTAQRKRKHGIITVVDPDAEAKKS
jgi:transposase